jgi:plastocyanin
MKTISRPSTWVCGVILAASFALMSATAQTQPAPEDTGLQETETTKKIPPPPPPPPLQIAGSWTGNIQDSQLGAGTINFTFTERKASKIKSALKGSWNSSFPASGSAGPFTDAGAQTGSVTAVSLSMTLVPKRGDHLACKIVFTSIAATQENITGAYIFRGACKEKNTGTITLQAVPQVVTPSVVIKDDVFSPANLMITAGQTVQWKNKGAEQHTVTANPGAENCAPTSDETFDSPTMNPGDTFSHTFNNAGSFAYHCIVHGCPMNGTVTVM